MTLWLLLLALFLVLFGAPVLVWWRANSVKLQQQMINAIHAGVRPAEAIARPVVLVEPLRTKPRGLMALFEPASAGPGEQAGWSHGRLAVLTVAAALGGLLIGYQFRGLLGLFTLVLGAAAGAVVPWMYNAKKARKRLAAIEEQFPEALDCLSRSIRAGNAFSVAIELLCAETQEPLKNEIQKLTREMALGARLEDALNGLIVRVPLVEVRFFVSAVLLQRETGGNLSEVIGKLAASLRERFKVRGQVKAASGQGRLTAAVLTVLPVATLLMLRVASPIYLQGLTDDPMGRDLMGVAAVSQIVGYIVMKRIINIEV
jgi:tight adherence protein B